jgi:hypothetical protein
MTDHTVLRVFTHSLPHACLRVYLHADLAQVPYMGVHRHLREAGEIFSVHVWCTCANQKGLESPALLPNLHRLPIPFPPRGDLAREEQHQRSGLSSVHPLYSSFNNNGNQNRSQEPRGSTDHL